AAVVAVIAHHGGGDDFLALVDAEEGHALRLATDKADIGHRHADDLPARGDQHDIVRILYVIGADDFPVLGGELHVPDPAAAAAGGAVFIGGGAFAEALGRDGEQEILLRGQFVEAFVRQHDVAGGFILVAFRSLLLAQQGGAFQIGATFVRRGLHVFDDGDGNN